MKKVLLMIGGQSVDYLADMVWISMMTDKSISCESNLYPSFFFLKRNLEITWGKGFTLYGKLNSKYIKSNPSLQELKFLIQTNFYDYVIYPSIRRFDKLFVFASEIMGKDRVIAIDGEDDKNISWHLNHSTYYKRELTDMAHENGAKPISFFIPEIIIEEIKSKINCSAAKKLLLAPCDPRDKNTYIYQDEINYFKQYQDAYFGYTMRKGGWDCLRHYEIIASGSVPYFEDYERIPKFTMHNYPKKLQKKANDLYLKILNHNKITSEALEIYKNYQKEFENWLRESSISYGSKGLKDQIFNSNFDDYKNKVGMFSLVKINYFSNYEYLKERNKHNNYFIKVEIFFKSIRSLIKLEIFLKLIKLFVKSLRKSLFKKN